MYKILIVEDDEKISAVLAEHIQKYGYDVVRAVRFDNIKLEFMEFQPHLVLLDINLPHFDGFYWCRQIRVASNVPVIFLSARVGEMDQVLAIENGGDDYITKPFHLDVVMAKIKGVLRRVYGEYALATAERESLEIEELRLDKAKFILELHGRQTVLSKNECLLVSCLLDRVGRIVSRSQLLEALWDDCDFVDDNTLTVNVTRVRKKLEEIGIYEAIETIRGQGYRMNIVWKGQDEQKEGRI